MVREPFILSPQSRPDSDSAADFIHSCLDSCEAYEETCQTYTDLRVLQRTIRMLAQVVDSTEQQVKSSVVASPWRRGLDSLPSEIVVEIIEVAGLRHMHEREALQGLLRTLLRVPGLAEHVKDARIVTRLLTDPLTFQGSIPTNIDLGTITKFYFTSNSSPFHVIAPALRQMTSLRHLEVSADFPFATLYRYNTDWVASRQITMPKLESLSVFDGCQTDNPTQCNRLEPDWSPNNNCRTNLSWVLGTLDTPRLRSVSASLTLHAGRGRNSNALTYALGGSMSPIETFELKEVVLQDRLKADGVHFRRL